MNKETIEQKPHGIHSISIPTPPRIEINNNTTTPLQLINSGIYTEQELMNYIEDRLCEGLTYRQLSIQLNVKLTSFIDWCSKPERYARIRLALMISADYYFEQSIEVLKNCQNEKLAIMLAEKLSSRYAWAASKRNSKVYGEKLDVTSEGQQIVQVSLGTGIKPPDATETVDYIDVTP